MKLYQDLVGLTNMNDKTPIDITAGMVALGAVTDVLPALASLFTIVWMALRIWETETVKKLTGRK